ncbi:hypothetical protein GQ457_16G008000 [Hibiscus cannabinus]
MLKDDILNFFDKFYKGDVQEDSCNHSFIVLIPKVQNPLKNRVQTYQSSGLCVQDAIEGVGFMFGRSTW